MKLGQRVLPWYPVRLPAPHTVRFPKPIRWRIAIAGITLIAAVGAAANNAAAPYHTSHGPSVDSSPAATPHSSEGTHDHECSDTALVETQVGPLCTHGDDSQFEAEGEDPLDHLIESAAASLTPDTARTAIPCHGDGVSGNRIVFVYAYLAGHANRWSQVLGTLRDAIYRANGIVNASAMQTGGHRFLRVLTNSSCVPVIPTVVLPATAELSFSKTINYLQTKYRYTSQARKFVVFGDFNRYCGIGTIDGDDTHGLANRNNRGPSYSRVDTRCWNSHTVAHEIFHNLGAVQMSAPHSDGTWHCTDTYDLMCYNAGGKQMVMRCTSSALYMRADCGKNDYFSTKPPAGTYLVTHWNAATNSFLYGGGPAYVTKPGIPGGLSATMTSATSARVAWSKASGTVTGYSLYRNGIRVYKGAALAWVDPLAVRGISTYRVQAYNAAGVGGWSSTVTATLLKPGIPGGLSVRLVTGVGTQLAWTASSGVVDGYRIYGIQSSGQRTGVLQRTVETSFLDLTSHAWTRYQVCAYNAVGESCASSA